MAGLIFGDEATEVMANHAAGSTTPLPKPAHGGMNNFMPWKWDTTTKEATDVAEPQGNGFDNVLNAPARGLLRGISGATRIAAGMFPDSAWNPTYAEPVRSWLYDKADFIDKEVVEPLTPNAATLGLASRILGGAAELPGGLLVGGPVGLAVTSAVNTGTSLVDQGVDATSATLAGIGAGVTNAAMMAIPGSGQTLKGTLGLMAATPVLGAASRYATQQGLEAAGYPEQAKGFDPFDPAALGTDLAFAGLFGTMGYRAGKYQREATADVGKLAQRWDAMKEQLPVEVVDSAHVMGTWLQALESNPHNEAVKGAVEVHLNALDKAMSDIQSGKTVDIGREVKSLFGADYTTPTAKAFENHLQDVWHLDDEQTAATMAVTNAFARYKGEHLDDYINRTFAGGENREPIGNAVFHQTEPPLNLPLDSFGSFETGRAVTFDFIHNTESATELFGKPTKNSPHDRGFEPSGRYVTEHYDVADPSLQRNTITGKLTFENPLVIKWDGWKRNLSESFGGKSGKKLSKAILRSGYDGVVTIGNDRGGKHVSEIVDLTTFEEAKALYQSSANVSAFGPIWRDFHHDSAGAVAKLKAEQTGEAIGALHHVAVGDIDLVWGKEGTGESDGYGLAKIIKFHPEVVDSLQEVLDTLVKNDIKSTDSYTVLESSDHRAVIRLDWDRKYKAWLLTEFKKRVGDEKIADTSTLAGTGDTALRSTDSLDVSSITTFDEDVKLFQDSRGAVSFLNDGRAVLHALKNPDISTVMHELAHVWRRQLEPEELKIANEFFAEPGNKWTRNSEEKFARAFEKYLSDGKSPNEELKGVFEKFKIWLVDIYRGIVGSPLENQITGNVHHMFDTMLSKERTPEEIAYRKNAAEITAEAAKTEQGGGDFSWQKQKEKAAGRSASETGTGDQGPITASAEPRPLGEWFPETTDHQGADTSPPPQLRRKNGDAETIIQAINRLGGINKEEAQAQWGSTLTEGIATGKNAPFRKNGLTIDRITEHLAEDGYLPKDEHGKPEVGALENALTRSMAGEDVLSNHVTDKALERRAIAAETAAQRSNTPTAEMSDAEYAKLINEINAKDNSDPLSRSINTLLEQRGDFPLYEQTATGIKGDENRTISAREALAEARREIESAQNQADAFEVAANCLRF